MRFWTRHFSSLLVSLICAASHARVLAAQVREVAGIVRNDNTDAPIPNVHVLAVGTTDSTVASHDGRYSLQLPTGSHQLRFSHWGYAPLTVVVVVGTDASTALDASLTPLPAQLPGVRVSTTPVVHKSNDSLPVLASTPQINANGGLVWSQASIHNAPQLDRTDLFRLLGTAPITTAASESPSSLHIAGGSADENLILLDGIPLENAVHAGTITSAIDPEAIDSMTLYADHTPARFGERLSGVVDLHTTSTPILSGTIASSDMAIRMAGRDTTKGVAGLISLRHSAQQFDQLWPLYNKSDFLQHTGWFDGLARGSAPVAGGSLSALAFQSHDVLHVSGAVDPFAFGSGFEWTSSAFGGTWTRPLDTLGKKDITVRAWQSNTQIHSAWSAYPSYIRVMENALTQNGASAEMHTTHGHLETQTGLITEHFHTSYTVSRYNAFAQSVTALDPSSQFALPGRLSTTSAYTDLLWHLSPLLSVTPGGRLTYQEIPGQREWRFDPRFGVTVFPKHRIQLSGYYSKTSQPVQSFRNEEEVFDGMVGLNLLSTQNDKIPLAKSVTLSGMINADLGASTMLTFGEYRRRLHDIVVDSGVADAPFFSAPPAIADGYSKGWYTTITHATPRFMAAASGRVMVSEFRTNSDKYSYQPEFAATRFATLTLAWHPVPRTELRAFGIIVGGRSAAPILTLFGVDSTQSDTVPPSHPAGGAAIGDPVNMRLPTYYSINVGAAHQIALRPLSTSQQSGLRVFVAVDNVFDRPNIIGYSSGAPGIVRYRPRSWIAGLDWQR